MLFKIGISALHEVALSYSSYVRHSLWLLSVHCLFYHPTSSSNTPCSKCDNLTLQHAIILSYRAYSILPCVHHTIINRKRGKYSLIS
ncbi:hypothetical protein F4860DRAFT_477032 [Xylaria cubensis]|nr:hypothetical protein F4860DRAFT_477032 [Xylaria cubensis]